MRKSKPNSSKPTAPATPKGAVVAGLVDGQPIYLSPRDRSMQTLAIGATGTGKTTWQEGLCRQDILANNSLAVFDPMRSLFQRLVSFICYLKAIGYFVRDTILFNASQPEWILPFNPFARRDGDLAVQVDRRVAATLRVWGQHRGDETPRLEKWLKIVYHAVIECGLTVVEAASIIDQHSQQLRLYVAQGLQSPLIRSKLSQLSAYRPHEFLEQTESVDNRLMRFVTSGTICRIMGVGHNALDFEAMMDTGQNLLCNLAVSNHLSREQRRLIGTLLLNEFFEAALKREGGAKPYYLYVDEAAEFVTPEMGEALEQCRQKGLHLILSFQHLAQFRSGTDDRLYKAIKNNARNKLCFAVPDREDAMELAADLFVGLTEPQIKYMHRHLSHLIEDVRQTSTTRSSGRSHSVGQSWAVAVGTSHSTGTSAGASRGRTAGRSMSSSESRGESRGESWQETAGQSRTETESEAHSRGRADTVGQSTTTSESHIESHSNSGAQTTSNGIAITVSTSEDGDLLALVSSENQGHAETVGNNIGQADTTGNAHTDSESHTESRQDTEGHSLALTDSTSQSRGGNVGQNFSKSQQAGKNQGWSAGQSWEQNQSRGRSRSRSQGQSTTRDTSRSKSVTDQPGVRHTAFWEERPEFWSLEEQRWRAAELLMGQPVGHCLIKTASGQLGMACIPQPKKFYILPQTLLRFTRELYERHCLTREQAEAALAQRQAELASRLQQLPGSQVVPPTTPEFEHPTSLPPISIWNRLGNTRAETRTGSPPSPAEPPGTGTSAGNGQIPQAHQPNGRRRRGPKPDRENHAKVQRIISAYGDNWATDDNLRDICEQLDREQVPIPKTWPLRRDGKSRSWGRAVENYAHLVVKAIKDRLKAATQQELPFDGALPPTAT